MNHKQFQDAIILFLEKNLPVAERNECLAHLQECNQCRSYAKLVEKTLKLERSRVELDLPPGLQYRIRNKINKKMSFAKTLELPRAKLAFLIVTAVIGFFQGTVQYELFTEKWSQFALDYTLEPEDKSIIGRNGGWSK